MKIGFQKNIKEISKIRLFCKRHIDFILALLFIGLMSLAGFIAYKYIGATFQAPPEEKILEIQARQVRLKTNTLQEVLGRLEKRESELAESLDKDYRNPFLPY